MQDYDLSPSAAFCFAARAKHAVAPLKFAGKEK
jgi:hypothetical protein